MSSVLAVSIFGSVQLCRAESTVGAVVESKKVKPEEPFQPLEVSAPQEPVLETLSETDEQSPPVEFVEMPVEVLAEEPVVAVVQTQFFKPVQTLEERRDAMLFESQALLDTPFDQAITMSFDNL